MLSYFQVVPMPYSPSFLEQIAKAPFYRGQIVHIERIPERKARYGELEKPLHPLLQKALEEAGIKALYSHQAQAINAIRRGENVIVSTGTASGKTLVYNIPVLEAILQDRRTRALYLFPTKALAQDQLRSLAELTRFSPIPFGTYDGDTPQSARNRLRKIASIILTNPDMLHVGILPNHRLWSSFLTHLKFVVIDEAHVYRGVFGSQVACVLRRLRRLCQFYGSNPIFILCSATIANPKEHAQELLGLPVTVIDDDGAPRGARDFVFWNPPFIDLARTTRRSPNSEATALFVEAVKQGIRTIVFTKARKVAELILRYAREALSRDSPELTPLIKAYRAGYLPEERRQIERELFGGKLLGVTATNALELGIDIGTLDATILVGYPGTIASTWQQAGRAGRGVRRALTILIGLDNPLDQYFMRHPQEFFGKSHENALIDPDNPYILEQHLACAAYERPLESSDESLFGPGYREAVERLEKQGAIQNRHGRFFYILHNYPAESVSLRSVGGKSVRLLDVTQGIVLEEIEASTAPYRAHPGAIYLHQGETYLVTELDLEEGVALLKPVDVDYYTEPREINEVSIIRSVKNRPINGAMAYLGYLRVYQQVIGYKKIRQYTEATIGVEFLDMPPVVFDTVGLWFDLPRGALEEVRAKKLDWHGGLHAVEHASIGMLPLFAMCDRWDIGGLSTPCHPDTGKAQVFIYDAFPGGVGIAEKGFELLPQLLEVTLELISSCPCEGGCPSCIQSPKCGNNNEPLDKEAAIVILRHLLHPPAPP
jgi:DEAD/DEAH box helicase domain-containing protein